MSPIDSYRHLFGLTGRTYIVVAFLARLPLAMSQLGTLLLVSAATGSYGAGGFCAGALAVANAVGAPFWGARADRLGQRRVVAFQSSRAARHRRRPRRRGRRTPLGRRRGRERDRGSASAADRSAGSRAVAAHHRRHGIAPARPRRRRLLLRGRGRRGVLRPRPGARRARRLRRQPDGSPGPRGRRPRRLRHVVRPARDRGGDARRDVEDDRRRRPADDAGPRRPRASPSCSSARVFGSVQTGTSVLATAAGSPGLTGYFHALLGVGSVIAGLAVAGLPARFALSARLRWFAVGLLALSAPLLLVGSLAALVPVLLVLGLHRRALHDHDVHPGRARHAAVPHRRGDDGPRRRDRARLRARRRARRAPRRLGRPHAGVCRHGRRRRRRGPRVVGLPSGPRARRAPSASPTPPRTPSRARRSVRSQHRPAELARLRTRQLRRSPPPAEFWRGLRARTGPTSPPRRSCGAPRGEPAPTSPAPAELLRAQRSQAQAHRGPGGRGEAELLVEPRPLPGREELDDRGLGLVTQPVEDPDDAGPGQPLPARPGRVATLLTRPQTPFGLTGEGVSKRRPAIAPATTSRRRPRPRRRRPGPPSSSRSNHAVAASRQPGSSTPRHAHRREHQGPEPTHGGGIGGGRPPRRPRRSSERPR